MKSCLGIIFIFFAIAALLITVAYNFSIHESLHFERRDSQPIHVNPRRTERIDKPTESLIEVIALPDTPTES